MTDKEVFDLIKNELTEQTLGVTEQYLEVHQPVYENGILKIDRIDRESNDDLIVAYLPVEDEYFHFAVYIDPLKKEIFNVGTESRNQVSLCITSENLMLQDLPLLRTIQPIRRWNKGDLRSNKRTTYNYTLVEYEPNPEADEFEDKLLKLLKILSNEKELQTLITTANAYVRVVMDFHRGNQLLGAASVNMECLTMLTRLKLPIHFEFAAWGKPFK